MCSIWRRVKSKVARETIAPGIGSTGAIGVVVTGGPLDCGLVQLACLVAKRAQRRIYLLHIIEVPRTLPLKATLPTASVFADAVLTEALALVDEAGCEATAEIVQARDAATAIVDEAFDQSYTLLLLGLVRTPRIGCSANPTLNATLLYILSHATCRVWALQDS
jgi:Universal stress protein family